ncbi:cap-specific mRNA (nucleoside-2'-O-)-methyltransferase 2-like [Glandiceps talaboti]
MGRKRKRPQQYGCNNDNYRRRDFSPPVMDEASAVFTKRFTFVTPGGDDTWSLPGADDFFVTEYVDVNETLSTMKSELNSTKSSLSDKDMQSWHEHTMFTNKAGRVVPHIRADYKPELCTQAWCKFREIVGTFDVIPELAVQSRELNTVHLCEAPGAFITSLNHYIKTNVKVDIYWEWLGSTLNPYYEGNDLSTMIPDDRFIYETSHRWYFGEDDTGDMTDVGVMEELVKECKLRLGDVHLVTADGSIDCQVNPAEQESLVSHLHYCEVITALQCLSPAGNLVVKMFTFFEHSATCLMYFLNCMFEKVHVFKPSTSKAGNSEVYVICLNYNAKDKIEIYLPKLIQAFGKLAFNQKSMYMLSASDIPASFMTQLIECAQLFKQYQTETIDSNVTMYESIDLAQRQHIQQVRDCCLQMYIERFGVKYMPRGQQICPDLYKQDHYLRNQVISSTKARHVGSYNDRQDEQNWWTNLHKTIDGWLLSDSEDFYFQNSVDFSMASLDLTILYGKAIDRVRSSRFCQPKLLDDINKAVTTAKIFGRENSETLSELMSANLEAIHCSLINQISQAINQEIQFKNRTNHKLRIYKHKQDGCTEIRLITDKNTDYTFQNELF